VTTCPSCKDDVDRDQLFDERACPECDTHLDDLYRIANDLPTRREQREFLAGGSS